MRAAIIPALLTVALAAGFAPATPAQATSMLPVISGVTFKATKNSTYAITITGSNFGAVPSDVPCTACYPGELQVVDLTNQPQPREMNVTSWSESTITLTGVTLGKGDAVRVAVYNVSAKNTAAFGSRTEAAAAGTPKVKSLKASGKGQNLTITIAGSGFGAAPSVVGTTATSPFLVATDFNAKAPDTDGFPWNAGYCGGSDCDIVPVDYASWTDTKIVLHGFGNGYGGNYIVNPHDSLCVGVWPSTSTSNGTTGGAVACTRLP